MGGNLQVDPLTGVDSSLIDNGDRLRSWGWPIPHELLVFGGDGTGNLFGVWYPLGASPNPPLPVVMIGEIFDGPNLALFGTDLERFLRGWSAYYLQLLGAPSVALDPLGLPHELRPIDDQSGLAPYFAWADPGLPDSDPDPYTRGVDVSGLKELISKIGQN